MIVYDVQHLTKRYPGQESPANDDLCLQVAEGEILGLLGENGSGKTTLVRQMVNLLRPTAGSITLHGRPLSGEPLLVPGNVGYMPQDSAALNNLTVAEALYYTAHLRGMSGADALRERDDLIETWNLGALRDRYSTRLSGGERRLLRLAVATAGRLPVLVLDEPTNDLDPLRRLMVWDELRRSNAERGTTILFITHDAIEAEKIVQRVAILRAGRLVAVGSPAELKRAVDRKLRLEMHYTAGAPPNLPAGLALREVQPGRGVVLVDRNEAGALLSGLDMAAVEDMSLHSATLEDLYVHYSRKD